MSGQPEFLIVGGGLAGAKAAEALRQAGASGRITLVAAEPVPPYERPPLSKAYLIGGTARLAVHDLGWYAEHDVELRLGRPVADVDPVHHQVTLSSGERLGFRGLLLATGATPRRLDMPGSELSGIGYLRDVADADRLRAEVGGGGRQVVVVGGGWIGLEVAAGVRTLGNAVTVIEPQETPLHAVLGPELGAVFARLHREHGVDLRVRTGVRGFVGSDGRVTGVETDDGGTIPADTVVVGVGVRPNVELAESAGLAVDNGIVTDAALRTSHPDVFAAGDIVRSYRPRYGTHLRVEHWANARQSGEAAGRSMLGDRTPYDPVPYFFTDQFDLGMEYVGHAPPGQYDRVVIRGDLDSGKFLAFWLAGERIVAGMNVNIWDVNDDIRHLIDTVAPVDDDRLADLDVPLGEVGR